jgi:hypothetical protein
MAIKLGGDEVNRDPFSDTPPPRAVDFDLRRRDIDPLGSSAESARS